MNTKGTHILMVTGIYPPEIGGPATYLRQCIPRFKAAGHSVSVVTFGDASAIHSEDGVEVRVVSRRSFVAFRFFSYLFAVITRARKADIMYVHDMSMGLIAARIASFFSRCPYIVRLGGDFLFERAYQKRDTDLSYEAFQGNEPFLYAQRRIWTTALLRHAKAIIVQGNFLKRIVCGWGISETRVHVVHNAIEEDADAGDVARDDILESVRVMQRSGKRVVLASGRFVRGKHFDVAIEAMRHAKDAHLLVMGDGPEKANYQAIISRSNLEDRVTLVPGKERAVARALTQAVDLYVLPSETDTFSFMTLEALLSGTPALLLRTGALEELFSEYEGKGVVYLDELKPGILGALLSDEATYREPEDEVKRALPARFDITTHFEAVHAIVLELGSREE